MPGVSTSGPDNAFVRHFEILHSGYVHDPPFDHLAADESGNVEAILRKPACAPRWVGPRTHRRRMFRRRAAVKLPVRHRTRKPVCAAAACVCTADEGGVRPGGVGSGSFRVCLGRSRIGGDPERTVGAVGHLLPGQPGEVGRSADGVVRFEIHGHMAAATVLSFFFRPGWPGQYRRKGVTSGRNRWLRQFFGDSAAERRHRVSKGDSIGSVSAAVQAVLMHTRTLWWRRNSPGVLQIGSGKTAGFGRSSDLLLALRSGPR